MRDFAAQDEEIDQLPRLDDSGRRQWLDRHRPEPSDASWWLNLLARVDHRWAERPTERAAWVELTLWLLDQIAERAVLSRSDVAERRAYFISRMRRAGIASTVLPSPDAVVRECLNAIPVTVADAVLADRRDQPTMLASRQARNLVTAAEHHLDGIKDPDLARCLREWLTAKPHLV